MSETKGRDPPPPTDPDWMALVKASGVGEPLWMSLGPPEQFRRGIRGVYCVLTKQFRVRCGILTSEPDDRGQTLTHYEGDREGAAMWLRYRGVPVSTIGLRLAECLHLYIPQTTTQEKKHAERKAHTRYRRDLDSEW